MSTSPAPLHAPNVAGLLPESAVSTLIDHAVKMPASVVAMLSIAHDVRRYATRKTPMTHSAPVKTFPTLV